MSTSNQANKLLKVLAIGGSDPSGGAGIQADIKTLRRQGIYGLSALTAVTVQNTKGVDRVFPLPPQLVSEQISALAGDFDIMAVKIGMLAEAGIVEAVAAELRTHHLPGIVLDPIFYAHTGKELLSIEALPILIKNLLPLAEMITPNIKEAEIITKQRITNIEDMKIAAFRIGAMGVKNVFLKGGHLGDCATDILLCDGKLMVLRGEQIPGRQVHGTGCMLASVIAAELAKGKPLVEAARTAKVTVNRAVKYSLKLGKGLDILDNF